jgi:hypothetical protein
MPDEKIVNAKSGFQKHRQRDVTPLFIKSSSFDSLLLFKIITTVKSVFPAYTAALHSNSPFPDKERPLNESRQHPL